MGTAGQSEPSEPRGELERALQLLAAGDWQGAHAIVQEREEPVACAIHALVHRIEGDQDNARYWYRRAGLAPSAQDRAVDDELGELRRRLRGDG